MKHPRSRKLGVAIRDLTDLAPDDPRTTELIRRYDTWFISKPEEPGMDDPKFMVGWDLCNEVEELIDTITEEQTMTEVCREILEHVETVDGKDCVVYTPELHEHLTTCGSCQTMQRYINAHDAIPASNEEVNTMEDTKRNAAQIAGSITGKTVVVVGVTAAVTGRATKKAATVTKDFLVDTGIPTAKKGFWGTVKALRDYGAEVKLEVKKARRK